MRRFSDIEASFNRKIDLTPESVKARGKRTEEAVTNFFRMLSPRLEIRETTPEEDAGPDPNATLTPITIDRVIYLDGKPAIGAQITTAKDPRSRREKLEQIKKQPFIRLQEMKPQDTAIPKTLIFLDDEDLEKQRSVDKQIIASTINSLRFDLAQTKNPKEIDRVKNLISLLEGWEAEIEQKEKGNPN